jgi:hypothetical protein
MSLRDMGAMSLRDMGAMSLRDMGDRSQKSEVSATDSCRIVEPVTARTGELCSP